MHVGFLRSRPPVPQPHWELPGSAGVPPAQSLAQPRLSPPLGSTGNGAMALLRPGRCCSRRQAACSIALKLGGGQRDRMRAGRPRSQDKMRAGRPRSQAMPFRRCRGEWKPGRQAREQGSGTIGDVCLSPYRSQPDSSRRNSSSPEGTDSGESPLFITFGTVVTVSSAIADRWRFGGCRAWRLRPCREKGGPDVKQTCNRPLRVDG